MKQENINKKITEALESLDGLQRATPAPYLMTRVNARLSLSPARSIWSQVFSFMSRPSFAFMGLLFVMLVNLIILFSGGLGNNTTPIANNAGVYEIAINVSSNYDLENQEP